jgi:arylsulfatase A-like enzyme
MSTVKNVLFIMCDQLRWDYLSCMGHPHLETPNIDALAARGVIFNYAYCQAPLCGPSRMSFYTGRYMTTHGAIWNNVPPRIDEWTLGDHLAPLGVRTVLVGKTHMQANIADMKRLGIEPHSSLGVHLAECGFEPFERDDGMEPTGFHDPDLPYNRWLRAHGYDSDNPWHDFANSAAGPNGGVLSGWHMRWARLPARIKAEHSETAYMTGRGMECIDQLGEQPWCIHLSYIKPHWPYVAPAPYHALYGPEHVIPANRSARERQQPHPVHGAYMQHVDSSTFARDEVRETVIPAYMGLIREIDDQMGRLWAFLEARGLFENTMIVFTSDHGDYLGDHWLGEKELLHEESVRIPMIVYDPRPEADATRGQRLHGLVEGIDLIPTFVEALGGKPAYHRLEGLSLQPLLFEGDSAPWRDAAFAETDYSMRDARRDLGNATAECRGYMVRTARWKYLFWENYAPQLFDLDADYTEQNNLGEDPDYAAIRAELHERLFRWLRTRKLRVMRSDTQIENMGGEEKTRSRGVYRGFWGPDPD